MATTKQMIRDWLDEREPDDTHMIVVCDTFDYSDYPVYVKADANVNDVLQRYTFDNNMQRVMEVYNLKSDLEQQLNEHRAHNL